MHCPVILDNKLLSCKISFNEFPFVLHVSTFLIFQFQLFSVTSQRYEIDILRESVIIGNDAIFKCSIPSFVSDFVSVDSWVDSEAKSVGLGSLGNSYYNHTAL